MTAERSEGGHWREGIERQERRRGGELGGSGETSTPTERRRELYGTALERVDSPDDLPRPMVREHIGWIRGYEARARSLGEKDRPHAVERHLDIDTAGLDSRLREKASMAHATAFRSAEALVMAEMSARRDLLEKYGPWGPPRLEPDWLRHELPAKKALGPHWRDHVRGRSRGDGTTVDTRFPDHTEIVVVWKRDADGDWQVRTCFPRVAKPEKG